MTSDNRLLIAEDSATQVVFIKALLEDAGFDVEVVSNGHEALENIRQCLPALVVTDLEMPHMNGLELVEAVKDEFPSLPVVLITSHGSEEIAAEALKRGAASYVPKRNMENDIVETLRRILQVVQADRANEKLDSCIVSSKTEYILDNNLSLIPLLIARLQDAMRSNFLFDEGQLIQVGIALDEALMNAVIHGNLEVSSEFREVDDGKAYHELIDVRCQESPYCDRRVHVSACISKERALIIIRDDGPGFAPSLIRAAAVLVRVW